MKKFLILVLTTLFLVSCQSHNSSFNSKGSRNIANTVVLRNFLDDIARQMTKKGERITTVELEKKIMSYIKRKEGDMAHGNWTKMGLNKVQADDMKSLYDDVPHMRRVQKWVSENITRIVKMSDDVAYNSYKLIMKESGSMINPYAYGKAASTNMMSTRRALIKPPAMTKTPYQSINDKSSRVFTQIADVKDQAIKKIYMKNYMDLASRGKIDPRLMANTNEILESATQITKATGRAGLGSGCNAITKNASDDVIDGITSYMNQRSKMIQAEMKRITKDGRKATKAEIDNIMNKVDREAFEVSHGYTPIEAEAAVKRLKNKPCKVI